MCGRGPASDVLRYTTEHLQCCSCFLGRLMKTGGWLQLSVVILADCRFSARVRHAPVFIYIILRQGHGRRPRGDAAPEFGVGEDANADCPLRFCHVGTKKSVLWPSKYAKIRFRPGLRPGPRYSLRHRSHSFQLPVRSTHLSDCNFITRMLYKNCY